MSADRRLVLGLDFGGTKLAAGLVDATAGRVLAARRQPTETASAEQALATMLAMAHALLSEIAAPVEGVGINFGGPVDARRGVVLRSNHVAGWDEFPLVERVGAALGLPARLENDANGQALAEARYGAGRGSAALVYLNIGTGIGAGVVLDGRLFTGAHGLAGELGHMTIRPGGPRCPCGRDGCLEALCAGPALARRARERLALLTSAERQAAALVRCAGSLAAVSGRQITALAGEGDPLALAIIDAVLADLALGLANIATVLDPDVIVLGGGAAAYGPRQLERLRALLRERSFAPLANVTRVAPAQLGANAGILGGAALFAAP